jgi:hypothetical protein
MYPLAPVTITRESLGIASSESLRRIFVEVSIDQICNLLRSLQSSGFLSKPLQLLCLQRKPTTRSDRRIRACSRPALTEKPPVRKSCPWTSTCLASSAARLRICQNARLFNQLRSLERVVPCISEMNWTYEPSQTISLVRMSVLELLRCKWLGLACRTCLSGFTCTRVG